MIYYTLGNEWQRGAAHKEVRKREQNKYICPVELVEDSYLKNKE
jgi:hypothetical protein